jgi:hypothetical protein
VVELVTNLPPSGPTTILFLDLRGSLSLVDNTISRPVYGYDLRLVLKSAVTRTAGAVHTHPSEQCGKRIFSPLLTRETLRDLVLTSS